MTSPSASPPPRRKKASRPTRLADVVGFYRLAHDRLAESDDAADGLRDHGLEALVHIFFASAEFNARIVAPLSEGHSPWPVGAVPAPDLVDWAASRLPLSPEGRRAVADASTGWPALYHALLTDPVFRGALGEAPFAAPAVQATLARNVSVRGQVETISAVSVSGWAIAARPEDAPVRIEVCVDGSPVASGRADQFRRALQDVLGGDGLIGFDIALPPEPLVGDGDVMVEVRAGPGRVVIGSGRLSRRGPDIGLLERLAQDVAALRERLIRLERDLPVAMSGAGSDLDNYSAYYETWYRNAVFSRPAEAASVLVVLDGWGRPADVVQRSARAVLGQMQGGDVLALLTTPEDRMAMEDIAMRARWSGDVEVLVLPVPDTDAADRVTTALASHAGGDIVVLTDAEEALHPAALALAVDRMAREPVLQALYFDEDAVEREGAVDPTLRRHVDPMFRPGPDRDLLLQTPYCGRTLAFRRAALERIGLKPGCAGLHGCDALLRLEALPGAIGHVPAVMVTRLAPAAPIDASAWRACVEGELARAGIAATVAAHVDILGASVPGAVRVRRAAPAVTASVIIPTRDRLDLLKPCIDSLLAHRGDNRVGLDLIVVDHESREPETLDYLKGLTSEGTATVVPFVGPFNWALMNNRAAAEARGEVLVFLNNDTLVMAPDWLDALAAQAMRPEVGVAGARLIYGDGTIQHAGFLARDTAPDLMIHDGVGVPGGHGGYLGRHALSHATPAVTGACMAVRAEAFRSLGGFDAAELPVEGNDVDLCFRAQAAGLSVIYEPAATLYHLESKSRRFSFTGAAREASITAAAIVRERWGARFGQDPGFNPHFDRVARPFTRLRPPPLRRLLG